MDADRSDPEGAGVVEIEAIAMLDRDEIPQLLWNPGDEVILRVTLRANEEIGPSWIGYKLHHESAGMVSAWAGRDIPPMPPLAAGQIRQVDLHVRLWLGEGPHLIDLALATANPDRFVLVRYDAFRFGMGARPGGQGLVDLDPRVSFKDLP